MAATQRAATAMSRRRLGRRAGFAADALAFAIAMLGTTLPTPLYGLYRERFGFSEFMITVIFATYAVGVITSLLLFGGLSDKIGRRRVLLPGLALSACSAVCFLSANGLAVLLAGRILSELSAGIFTGTATATLIDLSPPGRRARATLVATMANMGALGAGPLIAGLLSQLAGSPLRLVFWVDLALLVPAAVGIWAMPEPIAAPGRGRLRPHGLSVPRETREIFIRAALPGIAGFAVIGLAAAVTPAFLGEGLGVTSRAVVGLVVFGVFAASTAGQATLEIVADGAAVPAGALALIAGMGLFVFGLAASSLALLVLGTVAAGFGQGLSFRAGLVAVQSAAPAAQRGEVTSVFFVVMYAALSLPVIGEGVLAQTVGLRAAGETFASVVAALSVVVLVVFARARRRIATARPSAPPTAQAGSAT